MAGDLSERGAELARALLAAMPPHLRLVDALAKEREAWVDAWFDVLKAQLRSRKATPARGAAPAGDVHLP